VADTLAVEDKVKDREALELVKPKLMALVSLMAIRVDPIAAAVVVLDVARTIAGQIRERFMMLPKPLFDVALLDMLEPAARAMIYARREQLRDEFDPSTARVPVALIEKANDLKQRMFRVCEYHLIDHPEARKVLDLVRPGTGHLDTANDLAQVARLYRDFRPQMSSDVAHFHFEDAAEAEQVADGIFRELGLTRDGKPKAKSDLAMRAWTHMAMTYEEVAAAGRWLFRKEGGEAMFPVLVSAARSPRSRTAKEKAPKQDATPVDERD
jgi:hypothetical protein